MNITTSRQVIAETEYHAYDRTADFLRDQLMMNLECYMQVRPGSRAAAECVRDRKTLRDELAQRLRADRRAARSANALKSA